jgi:enoyl-CoA hydratase
MGQAGYNTILYEKDKEEPHIAYITLNRPSKTNAISIGPTEVTGEIIDAVNRASDDNEVKVVIFKGSGDNFSAGFDLSTVYRVYGGRPGVRPQQARRLQMDNDHVLGMPRSILNCNKVTIAQIQGWCIEAGMWIVECCDIAVAAKNAKFAHRGQRLAFGGMPLMPLELLQGHTKKLTEQLITGRTFSAEEAEQVGIITKAVELEELESEVHSLAKAICLLPFDAIVMGKTCRRLVYDAAGMNSVMAQIAFHTLGTNIVYAEDEKEIVFIRDREMTGEREAFHKLHQSFEEALGKTKYFKSYLPPK